jgi:DNA polymerase III subunit epsilon
MPSLRVAYVDTETTGLSARSDRIIEIAVVLAEVDWETGAINQVLDQYDALQDPGRRIPPEAMAVHGITDAMVRGQRMDAQRAAQVLAAADLCLAHNSGFDKGFVGQVVPESLNYAWGCTCRGIPWRKLYPALGTTSLQGLSSFFGCAKGTAHRALGDVETTMDLVSLPGLQGGLAFQHYVLHKKVRRAGLNPQLVVLPEPRFQRVSGARGHAMQNMLAEQSLG